MILLRQFVAEIFSMFAGDPAMSVFTVAIAAAAVAIRLLTPLPSSLVGIGLILGCLSLLIIRVFGHAHNAGR